MFNKFDARKTILFQIKVLGRDIKKLLLQGTRVKCKICYKDSVVSPSYLNLSEHSNAIKTKLSIFDLAQINFQISKDFYAQFEKV